VRIRFILSGMPGVSAVEVNPITQMTTVTFDDSKVSVDEMRRALHVQQLEIIGEPKFIK
jgi:copper chaperone CopZ